MEADDLACPCWRHACEYVLTGISDEVYVCSGDAGILMRGSGVRRRRRVVDQADRTISTGKLHVLPRFHTRPIDVVVFHGSQRDLVLRGASRLDAFSGYPVRA